MSPALHFSIMSAARLPTRPATCMSVARPLQNRDWCGWQSLQAGCGKTHTSRQQLRVASRNSNYTMAPKLWEPRAFSLDDARSLKCAPSIRRMGALDASRQVRRMHSNWRPTKIKPGRRSQTRLLAILHESVGRHLKFRHPCII